MMEKRTTQLGELISAMYDAAGGEDEEHRDDRTVSYLAALSTFDLLLRSGNPQIAIRLLNA